MALVSAGVSVCNNLAQYRTRPKSPLRIGPPDGAAQFASNDGFVAGTLLTPTSRDGRELPARRGTSPAGDPLLRSACQLRCLATPVVLRDAWMARHALGVLNQQRRDSVHEVFRNVVKHPGP